MEYYYNKFIDYLIDNDIKVSIHYFLILKQIKEIIKLWEVKTWRSKMSDKLKLYFTEFNPWNLDNIKVKIDLNLLKFIDYETLKNWHKINRIDTIQIKNFRWFWQYWDDDEWCFFDFNNKNKIILYWPNWSWKSCFTEALEYALTWEIKECIRKGKDLKKYIQSKWKIWSKIPKIFINNKIIDLSISEKEKLKNCFIEKNRITEFSLFKSKDTWLKDYREVLSILLWLWELDNFIWSFVQKNYFTLSNKEKIEQIEKNIEKTAEAIKDKEIIFKEKKGKIEELKKKLISWWILNKDTLEKENNIIIWLKSEIEWYETKLRLADQLKNLHEIKEDEILDLKKQLHEKNKKLKKIMKKIHEKKWYINMKKWYIALTKTENKIVMYDNIVPILPYFSCSAWFTFTAYEKRWWKDTPYLQSRFDLWICSDKKFSWHWVWLSWLWAERRAKNFGKDKEQFWMWLTFLHPIFLWILAFDKSKYKK